MKSFSVSRMEFKPDSRVYNQTIFMLNQLKLYKMQNSATAGFVERQDGRKGTRNKQYRPYIENRFLLE
jgi:hypothetical protein